MLVLQIFSLIFVLIFEAKFYVLNEIISFNEAEFNDLKKHQDMFKQCTDA